MHTFYHTDSKDPDIDVIDGWMSGAKTHPVRTIHEDRKLQLLGLGSKKEKLHTQTSYQEW